MASFITYYVQNKGGTVSSAQIVPLSARFANALVAYMRYIGKSFWPTGLSQIYAYPAHWPLGWVAAAALILVLISALVLWQARWRPYLFTGWFWFIGMLVPTIGLVQVGPQSMADRYTYLPSIGLFILVVWAAHDLILGSEPLSQPLSRSGPKLRRRESGRGEESHSPTHPFTHSRAFLRILIPVVALASCLIATRLQLAYWQDGETLFRHAVEVTKDNYIAYDYLGSALSDAGKYEEALPALRQSIKIQPHFAESQFNLGTVLLEQNKLEEAVEHLDAAVKGRPGYASAEMNLGSALLKLGRLPEATPHLAQAAQLKADDAGSHYNFGTALLRQSRFDEAVIELTAAVRLYPDYGEAHRNLGIALISTGQRFLALSHFERAVSLAPADSEAHFNFGLALLEQNHLSEAEAEFNKCISLGAADLRIHYRLASALSRQHKAKEAISHYREALRLSPDFPGTLNELAWLLACTPEQDLRSGNEAVTLAQKACELTGYKEASSTTTLAAAYAEAGRFTDAIATAQKARDLALAAGQQDIAAKAAESLKLYESGKPFREN
jgi:tetratricopeptide (TPR) repeat protein